MKSVKNGLSKVLLCVLVLLFIGESAPQGATWLQNTTFPMEDNDGDGQLGTFQVFNKYIVYIEEQPSTIVDDQVSYLVARFSCQVFERKSLKMLYKFSADQVICSENVALVYRKSTDNEGTYDRLKLELSSGKTTLLETNITGFSNWFDDRSVGNDVFVCDDAIYFMANNDYIENIQVDEYVWASALNQNIRNYKSENKNYFVDLTTGKRMESKENAIYKSIQYGIIYQQEDKYLWHKSDGKTVELGTKSPISYSVQPNKTFAGLNSSKDTLYLILSETSYVIVDLKKGIVNTYTLPGKFTGLVFKPNSPYPAFFYKEAELSGFENAWMEDVQFVTQKGHLIPIADSMAVYYFFKDQLIFSEAIEVMGHADIQPQEISIFNTVTSKKQSSTGCCIALVTVPGSNPYFYMTGLYGANEVCYLSSGKIVKASTFNVEQKLSYGIVMTKDAVSVRFNDKQGNGINQTSLAGTCIVVQPQSTQGYLYQAGKLTKIVLPDANRLDPCDFMLVSDHVIAYRYLGADKKSKFVRLITF